MHARVCVCVLERGPLKHMIHVTQGGMVNGSVSEF